MKVALSRRHRSNACAFQSVIEEFSTDQAGVCSACGLVLELEEEACFGGCRGSGCFCGRQSVEDICSEGEFLRERGGRFCQDGREEM